MTSKVDPRAVRVNQYTDVQNQQTTTDQFKSEKLQIFGFALQYMPILHVVVSTHQYIVFLILLGL